MCYAELRFLLNFWKKCDRSISAIKNKYHLSGAEIHTGWIMRTYLEQSKIPDFDKLSYDDRRREVIKMRKSDKSVFGIPFQHLFAV